MNKYLRYAAMGLGFVAINQVLIISPHLSQNIYYALMGLLFVVVLFAGGIQKINVLLGVFLFFCIVSIMMNDIPSHFQPWFRLISFIMVIGLIGPLVNSPKFYAFRYFAFSKANLAILVLGAGSFLTRVLPLGVPAGRGGWSGFFVHTMILGPMAAIALMISLYLFYKEKDKVDPIKKRMIFFQICIGSSFLSLLLASSRTAILACVAGLLFFFYKIYQQRFMKFLYSIILVTVITAGSYPIWSQYTTGIQQKMDSSEKKGDMTASRTSIWQARLMEFNQSPIYGIGFSHLIYKGGNESQKSDDGKIEPGSSFLAILAMTGLLGFSVFVILFISYLFFLLTNKFDMLSTAVLGSLMIFFTLHMLAEGYVLSSGGALFFYFWLLLGNIEMYKQTGKISII
ncbi:MAG TPA: O-antigen ligase family protein [Anditalea sp.]|nr:O-antigen ligase family protein [Anditalea sp.]